MAKKKLTAHLRNAHKGTALDSATESQLQLARCPKCAGYYCSAGVNAHATGCTRGATPARLPLATQLISKHVQSLVPTPPPHLQWTAGPPAAHPLGILASLIRSCTDLSFSGGLAEFYASGAAGSYRWDRWKEHFLCESRHRGPPLDGGGAPTSSDDAVSSLRGDSARPLPCALCSQPDSPFQARSILGLVDHMNHSHSLALDQRAPMDDVKRCACGYLYDDTAVGRDAHLQSCRHMADGRSLDYNPSLLPDSHATINILEILTRLTSSETPQGHFRRFEVGDGDANLALDSVECGSAYGLHTHCCFYLSHAAPADIADVDAAHPVTREHGELAIANKARFAPVATTLSSFLEPKLFTLLTEPADTEVFVCAAKDDGPLAVFNISVSPPRILLILESDVAADTPVRLILKTGEHFQRLFGPDRSEVTVGMLLALGPTRDQLFSVVPKPAPCLVGRITEWADSFCQKWRAAFPPLSGGGGGAPPAPPAPSQPPSEPSGRLTLLELASHNRLWRALPHGCDEQWLNSIRSDFIALCMFHSESDWDMRGRMLDSILHHPGPQAKYMKHKL